MTIRDITYVGEGLIPAPLDGPALRYTPLSKADVTDVVLHHWTGFLPPETWTAGEEVAYIFRTDEYHRTERGLDGIGYQLAPFPSGRVYIVSRLDRYGAHVGYQNSHLIGIGLPGSFRSHLPSARHLAATIEAVRYVYGYLGRDVPTTPHFYWGGTTCPGERWPEWVPQLRAAALQEDDMTPEETQAMITASLRDWIGPRDETMARIDGDIATLRSDLTALDGKVHGIIGSIVNRFRLIRAAGGSASKVAEDAKKIG